MPQAQPPKTAVGPLELAVRQPLLQLPLIFWAQHLTAYLKRVVIESIMIKNNLFKMN